MQPLCSACASRCKHALQLPETLWCDFSLCSGKLAIYRSGDDDAFCKLQCCFYQHVWSWRAGLLCTWSSGPFWLAGPTTDVNMVSRFNTGSQLYQGALPAPWSTDYKLATSVRAIICSKGSIDSVYALSTIPSWAQLEVSIWCNMKTIHYPNRVCWMHHGMFSHDQQMHGLCTCAIRPHSPLRNFYRQNIAFTSCIKQ